MQDIFVYIALLVAVIYLFKKFKPNQKNGNCNKDCDC